LSSDNADQQEEDTGGGGVDGILTRLHNHRIRSHKEYKAHHVAGQLLFYVNVTTRVVLSSTNI
jgi:hypothetical protein